MCVEVALDFQNLRESMARKIKISASILNLRVHPHTADIYKAFIQDLYELKAIVRLHGDRHGMISLINRSQSDDNIITGTITTFLNVDLDGSWFDTENLQEATDNQVSEVNIPRHLHPNAAQFFFHFDINEHKIYVQNYSKGKVLTPPQALMLFKELSERLSITSKYNLAKITLVQSKEGLKRIFSIDRIDKITITIMKPNADILAENFESQIEAHLAASHARKLSLTYQAEPGVSLALNKDIEKLSETALSNGAVEVIGRNDGASVRQSTESIPLIIQDKYDPDTTIEQQAFRRLINERKNAQ